MHKNKKSKRNTASCKECSHKVSRMANKCPKCGVSNPSLKGSHIAIGFLVVAAIVGTSSLFSEKEDTSFADRYFPKKDQACEPKDSKCIAESKEYYANTKCPYQIEKQSLYDHEWTNSSVSIFSDYSVSHENKTILYVGDQLKFTNEFNAKVNMSYRCLIDMETNEVMGVRVEPGRL